MSAKSLTTRGGLSVEVRETALSLDSALASVMSSIDTRKGAIFSSGFDYPGRHSRWDLGFTDPALEFVAQGRNFSIRALSAQGQAVLPLLVPPLKGCDAVSKFTEGKDELTGTVVQSDRFFSEEERSKQPSVFSILRTLRDFFGCSPAEAPHFGLYGAFGYDLLFQFENIKQRLDRRQETPDCHLFLPLSLVVVDRKKETAHRIEFGIQTPQGNTLNLAAEGRQFPLPTRTGQAKDEVISDHAPGEFAEKVRKVIEGTKRGDYFEVVLSQSFSVSCSTPPAELFKRLAQVNPSPYLFLLNFGKEQLVGSSPEIYLRVSGDRIETCPIAGTVARGASPLEDAERVQELLSSEKDQSELTMCTDVDRNDLARVCVPGTVQVIGRRQIEFYSHLIHTVDHVQGTLDPRFDALDAFQTHMWACTVTGAPKPAAVQEIENLEKSPRLFYAGAIGMLCFDGDLNTGITLRTLHLKDGRATVRAGATLLYGSDPDAEELETRTKAQASLSALLNESRPVSGKSKATVSSNGLALQKTKKVLLVDYRDSFVHNLGAYLRDLNADVTTVRHGFPTELLDTLKPALVFLSPGPFAPSDFGMPDFIRHLVAKKIPIFGVCLGHQGIGEAFGAKLGQLPLPMHGKVSSVSHNASSIFQGVEQNFEAGRYHSLYIREETLPGCLEVLARSRDSSPGVTGDGVIMGIRHRELPIAGVQFHPESLMTLKGMAGHRLLSNVLNLIAR